MTIQNLKQIGKTIYLNHDYLSKQSDEGKVNTLLHEYGHYLQEVELGFMQYFRWIALHSFLACARDTLFDSYTSYEYYAKPWERHADMLGGVNRYEYNQNVDNKAIWYYNLARKYGKVIWP